MIKQDFNYNWEVQTGSNSGLSLAPAKGISVTLPHDDLIHRERDKNAPTGNKKGFYPNGTVTLIKHFTAPAEWADKYVYLHFEGVYAHSKVFVNGAYAGGEATGYSSFNIELDRFLNYGQQNELKVTAVSTDDSRWYSGLGIYRDVALFVANAIHIPLNGLRVKTNSVINNVAALQVSTQVTNKSHHTQPLIVKYTIKDHHGNVVSQDQEPLTAFADNDTTVVNKRLDVNNPSLWSPTSPNLYQLRVDLLANEQIVDTVQTNLGIRTLGLNHEQGLIINGQSVKLAGACLHHDNGLLGAADIRDAEWRRIRKLHAAGFNAIRCSHNQASQNILNACDHYGMLVLNELSDAWDEPKNPQDVGLDFSSHWKYMANSLVDSSYNHPSVILYSIGNEIQSFGTSHGAQRARQIVAYLRHLDNTRYITNATNFLVTLGQVIGKKMAAQAKNNKGPAKMDINALAANMSSLIQEVITDDITAQATAETFATLDIAGYNYGTARYEMDGKKFPQRLILGTETYPYQIGENWSLIKKYPYLLGDFTWTGWDYLGECGIGQMHYDTNPAAFYGSYPWRSAGCGDFDLIGNRCPVSYYREIVFGKRSQPYIAVRYPWNKKKPQPFGFGCWGFIDGICSWTWDGYEGQDVTVEVYAAGREATLSLNGKKIATKKVKNHRAIFTIPYQPGTLRATSNGEAFTLTTAGKVRQIDAKPEQDTLEYDSGSLAYIDLSLVDKDGQLNSGDDRKISVKVTGSANLAGLGNADPKGEDNFTHEITHTYQGRALAILRPNAVGPVQITISSDGLPDRQLSINVIKAASN